MPGRMRPHNVSSPAPSDGPRTNATLVPCLGANRLTATTALSASSRLLFWNIDDPPTATTVPLPSGIATITASVPTVKQCVAPDGDRNANASSTLMVAARASAPTVQSPAAIFDCETAPVLSGPPSLGTNDD